MNTTDDPTPHDLFCNVRKAYRLLHDYQCMVRDAVSYISGQFDLQYIGCYPGLKRIGLDRTKLGTSSWDWLQMAFSEFRIQNDLRDGYWLVLSFYVISDTAVIEGNDPENISRFTDADKTTTRFAFILRKTQITPLEQRVYYGDWLELNNFLKTGGTLPAELNNAGYVGKSYDISCLTSETEANKVVNEIMELAKENKWPLEKRKK